MAKRLPYGISNFGSIGEGNYCYVDKTRFIEQLENESNKYQFFIRPRKFGKLYIGQHLFANATELIAMASQLDDEVYRRMGRANGTVRNFYETSRPVRQTCWTVSSSLAYRP